MNIAVASALKVAAELSLAAADMARRSEGGEGRIELGAAHDYQPQPPDGDYG
jgi:hypothetical protein